MIGDPAVCRELAAYLTGTEAKELADRLGDGDTVTSALTVVATARRDTVRGLLCRAGLGAADFALSVAVLRGIEGAHARRTSITPVWTAPDNLAQSGQLTASIHHYVTAARESVVCSTFNFQRSSVLWTALAVVSESPEVAVRIYVDTTAADLDVAPWKPTTQEIARAMLPATVLRTRAINDRIVRNHAKFIAVDHQYLVVTSANFSKSAEQFNVELGLVIENPTLAQSIERQMRELETYAYEVVRIDGKGD